MAGVKVEGLEQLERTMRDAGVSLDHLRNVHARVGDLIIKNARPPRKTGRLAASLGSRGEDRAAVLTTGVVYAGIQEARFHYLRNAIQGTQSRWMDMYRDEVQDICDQVRGT